MSTYAKKLEAPVVTLARELSLSERIAALGIHIPNQVEVARMMEAIRLGLPLSTPRWRIRLAWLRRRTAIRQQTHWHVYAYDAFIAGQYGNYIVEDTRVPKQVRDEAERIRAAIPDARIEIVALQNDPWLRVLWRNKLIYVRGWMGTKILL